MLATATTCDAPPTIWRLVSTKSKPIVVMNEGPAERHLYCVHSVTGDIVGLNGFAEHFGDIRLHGIQVPKQEMTRHLASTIEAIARHHVAVLETFQPQGPIHLIGWSAGAIVALEMAQQLRARNRCVPLLVALDGAPCNTGGGLSRRDPRYFLKVIANLPRWIRDDRTSDWSLKGIRNRLSEKLAARRGADAFKPIDTLDPGAVESVISRPGWSPAQKAFVHMMYQAMAAYVPKPYHGETLVFEMGTQPLLQLRQVGAAWRAVADRVCIVPVRGNHSGLIHEPTAAFLATEVKRRLDLDAAPNPQLGGEQVRANARELADV